jgi:hypothetical protein
MHAQPIVQHFVQTHLGTIHQSRQPTLTAAICAVMHGCCLRLSALARGIMAGGTLKAAFKRIDRLIGSERIATENDAASRGLLCQLCATSAHLVIAVDWSGASDGGAFVQLRASVTRPGMGRALTLYQAVYPKDQLGDRNAERVLLKTLKAWIPDNVRVTFVTDAGFRRPWFEDVGRMHWQWIGRVRQDPISRDGRCWTKPAQWFADATGKARRYVDVTLTRRFVWPCDLVLYRTPKRHRPRYGRPRRTTYPKAAMQARRSHSEPWLLAHSKELRDLRADEIVALYAQRMQIEETFRDTKSPTFAMGMHTCGSRSASRLLALLMIAMLAAFLLWHIGQLAEAEGLHRRFKATTRKARELSLVALGIALCRRPQQMLSDTAVQALRIRLGLS